MAPAKVSSRTRPTTWQYGEEDSILWENVDAMTGMFTLPVDYLYEEICTGIKPGGVSAAQCRQTKSGHTRNPEEQEGD